MQRVCLGVPLAIGLVAGGLSVSTLRSETPQAPAFVKPTAIPTSVTPVRQAPRSSVTAPPASDRRFHPAQNSVTSEPLSTPVPSPTHAAQTVDVTCGHWIVSSRRAYNEVGSRRPTPSLNYYYDRGDGGLRSVGEQAFTSAIANGAPTCVVVFGSYNRWEDASTETHPISRWLRSASPGQPLNVVFYTWPSDGVAPFAFPVEIALLGRRSSYQGVFLAELLARVPASQPLGLIGHSHGARTVASALHLMSGGEIEGNVRLAAPATGHASCRVVMLVGAMDHHWLNPGQRYGLAMSRVERLLNVKNTLDGALGLYTIRKPGATFALGGPGFDAADLAALGSEAAKITELDVSRYTGAGHSWQDIHGHRDIALALRPYVFFADDTCGVMPTSPTSVPLTEPAETSFGPRSPSGQVRLSPTTTTTPRTPAGPVSSPFRTSAPAPRRPTAPRFPNW
jgi:hypothetical protein